MPESAYVYMLATRRYGTLYTGITSNLIRRVHEHRQGIVPGFSKQYNVKRLVWYEVHTDVREAIAREKRLKHWKRVWKIELIQAMNPYWDDLYDEISR
ncbi:MAG TPA: GIY-YIG nuclease family protein [Telluria sp.]|nr:GIY-YIG nuclease family protein [Telluria sp.]